MSPQAKQKGQFTGEARKIGHKTHETVTPVPAPTTTPEDQKAPAAQGSGDQKSAKPAKKRGPSPTVTKWKNQELPPVTAKITLQGDFATKNPKRRDAARRFGFYRNGQTIEQYLEVTKAAGITPALAKADVRWDIAAGFIKAE